MIITNPMGAVGYVANPVLDGIDRKNLTVLQTGGRISSLDLAERVRLSPTRAVDESASRHRANAIVFADIDAVFGTARVAVLLTVWQWGAPRGIRFAVAYWFNPVHSRAELAIYSTPKPIPDRTMSATDVIDWHSDIFDVLLEEQIDVVAHVPDAGHGPLIKRCEAHNSIETITLTTEEEGVGIVSGAWAGGRKGVLLMQSSGVGNCINAIALPSICRIPFLTIISMRGEWGEFVPWQVPMGLGTPKVLEAMDVRLFRADRQTEVGETVSAAARFAFNTRQSAAVLLSQRMIGAKQFVEGK